MALDDAPHEQLLLLESRLDEAAREGVVRPLPTAAEAFTTQSFAAGHLRTLRNRLFRLGYLEKDSERDRIDATLQGGIKNFQRDADLTVDGWVGMQTWQALQELFAFEPVTELDRWLNNPKASVAVNRAAHLRLISFGLLGKRDQASDESIDDGLKRWPKVLNITEFPLAANPERNQLIAALFDYDKLAAHVTAQRALIRKQLKKLPDKPRALLKRFIVNLVSIELWLLGYDGVRPDGKAPRLTRKRRPRRQVRGRVRYNYSPFYTACRTFWKDCDLSREHAEDAVLLTRTLGGLADIETEPEDRQRERRVRSRQLIRVLDKDTERLQKNWSPAEFGGRLWDGVKRLWRLLRGLLKRAVSWLLDRAKQFARAAWQAAAEAFSLLKRGIKQFTSAVGLLFSGEVAGSNQTIALHHDRDFDFSLFLARGAPVSEVEKFFAPLRQLLEQLRSVVRVLAVFLRLARQTARLAAGPWAWWPLVRSLIGLYGKADDHGTRVLAQPLPA